MIYVGKDHVCLHFNNLEWIIYKIITQGYVFFYSILGCQAKLGFGGLPSADLALSFLQPILSPTANLLLTRWHPRDLKKWLQEELSII